jgi:cell division protein FtsA
VPRGIGGLVDVVSSPKYATGVGLVRFGMQQNGNGGDLSRVRDEKIFTRVVGRMKGWFQHLRS